MWQKHEEYGHKEIVLKLKEIKDKNRRHDQRPIYIPHWKSTRIIEKTKAQLQLLKEKLNQKTDSDIN